MHPKHEEALQRKAEVEKTRAAIDAMVKEAMKNGLKFLHMPPYTVAYVPGLKDVFAVSTAICNPKDSYSRKVGRRLATINFVRGQFIQMRKSPHLSDKEFFYGVFETASDGANYRERPEERKARQAAKRAAKKEEHKGEKRLDALLADLGESK